GAPEPAALLPSLQAVARSAAGPLSRLTTDRAREAAPRAGGFAGDRDRPHPRLQRDEFVLRGVPARHWPDPDRLPARARLTRRPTIAAAPVTETSHPAAPAPKPSICTHAAPLRRRACTSSRRCPHSARAPECSRRDKR